jgi:hypothetical protein
LKAVAQDALRLGARALETGRAWLSGRRGTMNERDSRRYEERERQRQASEQGRSEYGTRRASEDWDDTRPGRYGGGSEAGQAARMGRQYGSDMGREESDWSQGRRESQRWGEQGTYGAQGSNEFERYGSDQGRDRTYGGQFSDRIRDEYAQGRDHVSQERSRAYGNQDYSNQRGSGTQAYGQGEQSYGTHGYGSGREFRGYEGGEAGRSTGGRHWERGYGEGYGMSSGYADEQAYDSRYGASGYATGYASNPYEGRSQRAGAYGGTSSPRDYRRNYRGMGPKSYTRSDERVLEDINERLTEDDYLDASDITVRCVNGVITLEGTVADRWMKHRAEDLADASSGVKQVDNRIQVQSQSARMGSEQKAGESASAQSRSSRPAGSTGTTTRGSGDNQGPSSQH